MLTFNFATVAASGCLTGLNRPSNQPSIPCYLAAMTETKLSLLHVADWEFAPIPNRNAVVFRLHYVEGTTGQPHKDRKYVLTAVQAEGAARRTRRGSARA